jgi:two-component system, chemotaxis family, chemotaxis protein CheY
MITVLVIDADPAVRLAARRVLEPAGFTIIAVGDAAAALTRLAVLRADLVICDVDALAPDGRAATSAITNFDPSVQILALFPKHRDTAGMLPYVANALGKPFTASELLTKVRRSLVGPAPPSPLQD